MPGKKRKKQKAVQPARIKKTSKPKAANLRPSSSVKRGAKWDFFKKTYPAFICLFVIILVGFIAYSDSFQGPFVFDDDLNITRNKAIVSFGSALNETLRSRAVGYITFALNYKIHELEVVGYHIFNLVIHLTTALLVFWLVLLTLKTPVFKGNRLAENRFTPLIIALFAGLVFVTHPVQTQAVTYTVQRFTSLATLFYLLSLTLYAKWRLTEDRAKRYSLIGQKITLNPEIVRGIFYVGSLVSVFLAMQTKEIAFTLPAVIALWEFSFFSGSIKTRIKNLLPFISMLAVIPFVLLRGDFAILSAEGTTETPQLGDYVLTQFRVIVTYIRLLVLPVDQNLDYDYPVYQTFFNPNVFLSFIFLLAIAGLGVILWHFSKKRSNYAPLRLIAFGIFWFFITLSVESSFIVISDVIFEHRLYLPSIGLIAAVVMALAMATTALSEKIPHINKVILVLGAAVVIALSVATFERNKVWANPITLWEDTISKSQNKARPHYNLGYYYQHADMPENAETEYKRALELKPDFREALQSLGINYMNRKLYTEAISYFQRSIEVDPNDYKSHINLGTIYYQQGLYDLSYVEYMTALRINPNDSYAKKNIELLREKMKQ